MATPQPRPFAAVLRHYRMLAGLTQEALAERAGLSRRAISDLERGVNRRPHSSTLDLLVEGLQLSSAERADFMAAARWLPSLTVVPRSPRSSSSPQPEPASLTVDLDLAGAKGQSPKAVGNFLSAEPRRRLVAREAEMAALLATLDRVRAGTGQLVLLVGEPGVGKTRLAQEVLQAARVQGFGGITGRCYAPQASVPYYPFLEALSRAYAAAPAALRAALPLHWPEVSRLIPDLSPIRPTPHPESGSPADQQRLFWQVAGFLRALADELPMALLLDDLHWMDGASLELLLHLVRQTRDCPLLLLGTYRESEVSADHPLAAGVRDLIRADLVERVELLQLSRESTAALVATTLEGGDVATAVSDLIYTPTEGNAFFAQELLRTLLERGEILQDSNGRWESQAGASVAVPATVQAAVLERVARLSPPAQETLRLASVLGQRWSFDDLLASFRQVTQTAAAEAELRLEAELEEAVRVRVLREVGGTDYAFSHVLAQRAVYEQVSSRRRRRLHRGVAESLEGLGEAPRARRVADIAYHYQQADDPARAVPFVLQTGEQALLVYAYSEAEQQFRLALALAQQLGDGDAASMAAEQLGAALVWQGRDDEAFAVLEPAMTEAERQGDLARLARLSWLLNNTDVDQNVSAGWIARLLRLIELAKTQGPSPDLAHLYLSLSYQYMLGMQYEENLWAVEQALQVAEAVDDPLLVARARPWHATALYDAGRLEEALAELEAAVPVLEQQETLNDLEDLRSALIELGLVLTQLGRVREAHVHFERALALGEQLRSPGAVAAASECCCETAFVLGDWTATQRYIERAEGLRPHFETNPFYRGILYSGEGSLQLALGQWDAAAHSGETPLALAKERGNLAGLRTVQRVLAELDLHRGDPTSARDRLLPLLDRAGLVEPGVNPLLPLLVWAHLDRGELEVAEALAMQIVARLRAQHDYLNLVDALRVEAAVRIWQQRWGEAEVALEEALALARPMPYPYAEAKALAVYGDLLVAHGQPEQARDQYAAALAILRPLGEVPYTERIERALAELSRC